LCLLQIGAVLVDVLAFIIGRKIFMAPTLCAFCANGYTKREKIKETLTIGMYGVKLELEGSIHQTFMETVYFANEWKGVFKNYIYILK
jgi:hypothetical protein